jgi:tetratricopeptide (TPR) repeat protein
MRTILYFFIPVMIFFSCSTPSAPEYNEELTNFLNEVSKGWSFFEDGNVSLAATAFRKAIEFNSKGDRAEAYIGLGWCLAMEDSLTKAISAFTVATTRGPRTAKDSVNMLAGMSLVYRDITPPDFPKVRDYALAALKIDSKFVFEYKRSINAADLNAVLAEAYFNLEQYTEAAAIADPSHTLDPADPNYNEELLSKINQLITASLEGG